MDLNPMIIVTVLFLLAILGVKFLEKKWVVKRKALLDGAPELFLKKLDMLSRTGLRFVGKNATVIHSKYERDISNGSYHFYNICQTESKKWFVHEFTYYLRYEDRVYNESVSPVDEEWVKAAVSYNIELYSKFFGEPELA